MKKKTRKVNLGKTQGEQRFRLAQNRQNEERARASLICTKCFSRNADFLRGLGSNAILHRRAKSQNWGRGPQNT
jgi:hypothetical protein